jgi:predicted DNA-binding protein YlxM (UPF0122 family)
MLKVPAQYAGKKGRCPNCGKKIPIPTIEEIKKQKTATPQPEPEERHCPTCGAFMAPGETVCVSCHMDLNTGEWNMAGATANATPSAMHLYKIGVLGILAILILIFAILGIQKLKPGAEDTQSTKNETIATTQEPKENTTTQETTETITQTEESVQEPEITEDVLLKEYEQKKTDNMFQDWLLAEKILYKYSQSNYDKASLEHERLQAINQMCEFAKTNGAHELMHEFQTLYPTELMATIDGLEPEENHNHSDSTVAENKDISKDDITNIINNVKSEFDQYLPEYRMALKKRQYSDMYNRMKEMNEKLLPYLSELSQEPEIIRIQDTYIESCLLNEIWNYINEAKIPLKDYNIFFSKEYINKNANAENKESVLQDTIVSIRTEEEKPENKNEEELDFEENLIKHNLILDLQSGKNINIANLKATSIVQIILSNEENAKNPDLQVAIACLYYVDNEPADCLKKCQDILKSNQNSQYSAQIERYQQWAKGIKTEQESKIKSKIAKEEEIANKRGQETEKKRLERLRKRAESYAQQMLDAYRNHKEKLVLEIACKLKDDIGEKAGGRDELVRLNYNIKKEHGKTISNIIDDAFSYCTICGGAKTIKCPDCLGAGKIAGKKRQIGQKNNSPITIQEEDKFCKRCTGKGTILCPNCSDRINNRNYMLIKSYFGNF